MRKRTLLVRREQGADRPVFCCARLALCCISGSDGPCLRLKGLEIWAPELIEEG